MEDVDNVARKLESDIKFSQNWGGKLDEPRFTTFRGQDKLYKVGQHYPVTIVSGLYHNKESKGFAVLISVEFKRIQDVSIDEILADIGRRTSAQPRRYFFNIMKDFYQYKKWWDGEYTVLQKLTFEFIGRRGYVGS